MPYQAAPHVSIKQAEVLEDELEFIKAKLFWLLTMSRSKQEIKSIVAQTAGLLGKRFPKGVIFENRARKAWRQQFLT